MGVAEKNIGLALAGLLHTMTERAQARTAVDDDETPADPHLKARRLTAVADEIPAGCRDRSPHAPEAQQKLIRIVVHVLACPIFRPARRSCTHLEAEVFFAVLVVPSAYR